VVYSFFAGLIVYTVLARLGLEPKAVEMPQAGEAAAEG